MARKTNLSTKFYKKACAVMPGGVNSPVRAFKAVGGIPFFVERAKGSRIFDVDGNEYIDYVCSFGPLILGHSHPEIVKVVNQSVDKGTSYGAPNEQEIMFANVIIDRIPSIEMIRLVTSGTEAVMSSIRLARAYTKRDKIVKFSGCYHGHADYLLASAGSGMATLSIPGCPGVTKATAADTIIIEYNDMRAVEEIFKTIGESIACVIVEPIAGNMGVVLPKTGFLEMLRAITDKYESLLVFDEVITGFRVSPWSAQQRFGIYPDLTCLGKIIGGGFPIGAYGGKKKIMQMIAPEGDVYQAGTLSGNPVAVSAGLKTLELLTEDVYNLLDRKTETLAEGIRRAADKKGIAIAINQISSMLCPFLTDSPVLDYTTAKKSDTEKFAKLFHSPLDTGVSIAPSQFEAMFVSIAHSDEDIEKTISIFDKAFDNI